MATELREELISTTDTEQNSALEGDTSTKGRPSLSQRKVVSPKPATPQRAYLRCGRLRKVSPSSQKSDNLTGLPSPAWGRIFKWLLQKPIHLIQVIDCFLEPKPGFQSACWNKTWGQGTQHCQKAWSLCFQHQFFSFADLLLRTLTSW